MPSKDEIRKAAKAAYEAYGTDKFSHRLDGFLSLLDWDPDANFSIAEWHEIDEHEVNSYDKEDEDIVVHVALNGTAYTASSCKDVNHEEGFRAGAVVRVYNDGDYDLEVEAPDGIDGDYA